MKPHLFQSSEFGGHNPTGNHVLKEPV
jgi:hypothetical protein